MKKILIMLIAASVLLSGCGIFGKSNLPETEKTQQETAQNPENKENAENTEKEPGFFQKLFGGSSSKPKATATPKPSASSKPQPNKPLPEKVTQNGVTTAYGAYLGMWENNQLGIIESGTTPSSADSKYNILPELNFDQSSIEISSTVKFDYTTDENGVKTIIKISKYNGE